MSKDDKIISEAKQTGEPIFVLRAKDYLSIKMLSMYYAQCELFGCDKKHLLAIQVRMDEFEKWQSENEDKVKRPD